MNPNILNETFKLMQDQNVDPSKEAEKTHFKVKTFQGEFWGQ